MLASAEEVLRGKRFDALEPGELAQLYGLMARVTLATRCGARGAGSATATARGSTCAARCGKPAHGRRPGPSRRRRRRIGARRLVLLCDISGSMEPYARAYLQFLTCAGLGSGVRAPRRSCSPRG